MLLDVTYHLNATCSKSVSIGHDPSANFEPFVWMYKSGATKIKINSVDWKTLIAYDNLVQSHFKAEFFEDHAYTVGSNMTLSTKENYKKRLVCIEYFETGVTNHPKPALQVWLAESTWNNLLLLCPCIDLALERAMLCTTELQGLFEALGYHVDIACGSTLRQHYGNLDVLKELLKTFDAPNLMYESEKGLDVHRVLLEMKALCLPQIRDFVKYSK
jgi:hypothetical protein